MTTHVPKLDRFYSTAADREALAIRRKSDRIDGLKHAAKCRDLLKRGRFPQFGRSELARRSEKLSVRRKRCAPDQPYIQVQVPLVAGGQVFDQACTFKTEGET